MNDGAIILDCTTQNTPDRFRAEIIRPLAPFALHEVFVKRNIPSTVINYVDFWHTDILLETISLWCTKNNVKHPLVLCSTLFNDNLLNSGTQTAKTISSLVKHFNATLIVGGPINLLDYSMDAIKPTAVFQGRSLHLFERWLDGEVLECQNINGVALYHDTSSTVKESPVVPILYDDYCLTKNDIIHFETRLGCKFNCTFCTFEFRNAKAVHDATTEQLYNFFVSAKKYGITNFSCVDDTFNEDDKKLHTLHNAVTQLDYQPKIVGYNRFDLIMAKPYQLDILDECGFHGHYFGIETLHREASKLIRKGIRKKDAYIMLGVMRDSYPHWYTCSGYIVGIPKEPAAHIKQTIKEICDAKLIKSIIPVDLGIYNIPGNEHNFSEFSKNPQKYGLTVLENSIDANWKHELMTKGEAKLLATTLAAKNFKRGIPSLDPWEWISRKIVPNNALADTQINQYIRNKIAYTASL